MTIPRTGCPISVALDSRPCGNDTEVMYRLSLQCASVKRLQNQSEDLYMNQSLNIDSYITLRDGNRMPLLGLGVWEAHSGKETFNATLYALQSGYRHVDTAQMYGNEKDVGDAFHASGLEREEVFLTTKLWNSDHGYDAALRAFDKSLKRMKLDFVDLFLIHWPSRGSNLQTWRALERIRQEGRSRSIGVSNFAPKHIKELLENGNARPVVNQIELNPFLQQQAIVSFCEQENIRLTGYCPLGPGSSFQRSQHSTHCKRISKNICPGYDPLGIAAWSDCDSQIGSSSTN